MRLPDDAILTRPEMLSLLMEDARFVHLSATHLSGSLDAIYSAEGRGDADRAACAHEAFYAAWLQGKLPVQLFAAWDAVDQVARDLNTVCCICGAISLNWCHRLPGTLQKHLAPRITIFTYVEEGQTSERHWGPAPTCRSCSAPFIRRSRRGDYWQDGSSTWDNALAELSTDYSAKRRIRENAENWHKLRFDPRQPAREFQS